MPPALVPMVQPIDIGNKWELLYERFRKQQPLIFEGGPDPLKAEQWITMITTVDAVLRQQVINRIREWE